MNKETAQTQVLTKVKMLVGEKIIAVAIIISSLSSLFALGAFMTSPLWQKQAAVTTQQQNSATDQQMKIVVNPIDDGYKNFLVSLDDQQPIDETDDLNLHPGWPIRLNAMIGVGNAWPGMVSPVVDDINNDGMKELVIFTQGFPEAGNPSKLFIYSQDGRLLVESPSLEYNFDPWTLPSIVDINNDGQKEILITGYFWYEYNEHRILIFNNQGRVINFFNTSLIENAYNYKSLLIADINRDNNKEIIYIGWDFITGTSLVVLDSSGHNLTGFPIVLENTSGSGNALPVIADFNNDGYKEIVVASNIGGSPTSNVRAYDYHGNLLWETLTSVVKNKLIAADVNHDGVEEIVFNSNSGLYILDHSGSILTYLQLSNTVYNGPAAVGDLDNDGDLEIAFGHLSSVYVIHHDGQFIYGKSFTNFVYYNPTLIADINGDSTPEVIFGQSNEIYAWDFLGNLIQNFPLITRLNSLYILPTVADIDNNGDLELISNVSSYWWSPLYQPMIYVWDLNGQATQQSYEWPMFAHDVRHTGNYRSHQ